MQKFGIFAVMALLFVSLSPESSAVSEKIQPEEFCGTPRFYDYSIYYANNFPSAREYMGISKVSAQESEGEIRNFWIRDDYYGLSIWRSISAILVNVTNVSYIYAELKDLENNSVWYNGSNDGYITQDDVNVISAEFQRAYHNTRLYFGEERATGVDGDSHVTILLLDIDGDYANNWNGSGYTGGYYDSINEYSNSTLGCSDCVYSNQRKIVYIDIYPLMENGNRTNRIPDRNHSNSIFQEGINRSFSTIAHEFMHMIQNYRDPDEETWVNEGVAGYAEFVNGYGNPESHVQAFSKNPENSLTAWDGTLSDYGATYLFILYLSENYGNSTIRNLVNNTKNGIYGVNDTLQRMGYNETFQSIFPEWAIANVLSNYSAINLSMNYTGIYSYPANSTGDIELWASNYVNFSNGNGSSLNISISVSNSSGFDVSLIKINNNSTTINEIPLVGNAGSEIIDGFGSLCSHVMMVVTSSASGSYSYSAEYSAGTTTTTSSTTTYSATTTSTSTTTTSTSTITTSSTSTSTTTTTTLGTTTTLTTNTTATTTTSTTLGITTTTTSSTTTTTTIPSPCQLKGDKDCNGTVDDFELLDYINDWAKGTAGDFDLLEAINNWAKT